MSHKLWNDSSTLTGDVSRPVETLDIIQHFSDTSQQVNLKILRTAASDVSAKSKLSNESISMQNKHSGAATPASTIHHLNEYDPNDQKIKALKKRRNIKKVSSPLSKHGMYCIQFFPDGKHVAVGYGNGGVCFIANDETSPTIKATVSGQKKQFATMAMKCHLSQNLLLTAGAAGEVNAWDISNVCFPESKANIHEEGNEVNALDICADGMFFATAGKDRHIRLYDANSLRLYHTITAPDALAMDEMSIFGGHTQRVFALRFHPDQNHMFVTAGWDNCMKIWDKRMARAARQSIAGPRICGDALDICGNHIITGSYVAKDSLQIWDIRGNYLRNVNFPHNKQKGDFMYSAKFVDKTTILAGGSGINIACSVDLNGDVLSDVIDYDGKAVLAVDSWNGGEVLAVGGVGGVLQLAY